MAATSLTRVGSLKSPGVAGGWTLHPVSFKFKCQQQVWLPLAWIHNSALGCRGSLSQGQGILPALLGTVTPGPRPQDRARAQSSRSHLVAAARVPVWSPHEATPLTLGHQALGGGWGAFSRLLAPVQQQEMQVESEVILCSPRGLSCSGTALFLLGHGSELRDMQPSLPGDLLGVQTWPEVTRSCPSSGCVAGRPWGLGPLKLQVPGEGGWGLDTSSGSSSPWGSETKGHGISSFLKEL